jgi:hypothetical protein
MRRNARALTMRFSYELRAESNAARESSSSIFVRSASLRESKANNPTVHLGMSARAKNSL